MKWTLKGKYNLLGFVSRVILRMKDWKARSDYIGEAAECWLVPEDATIKYGKSATTLIRS
jgi:hypothetical protein